MPVKQLVENREAREAKAKQLRDLLGEGGWDAKDKNVDLDAITSIKGSHTDKLNEIRKLNESITELGEEVDALAEVEKSEVMLQRMEDHKDKVPPAARFKSENEPQQDVGIGDLIVATDAYKRKHAEGPTKLLLSAELKGGLGPLLKTVMTTSAGWAPESTRVGRWIEEQLRPIQVLDTIPGGQTSQPSILFMEETTVTDAAAERNEAAAYAESALAFTEQTSNVRSFGTSLPVTDEQLADEPMVRSYLNMRLPFLVRRRLDTQVLTGNGSAPNIRGINNLSGILTQAKSTDPEPDAIYKAMRQVRVTGRAQPNIVYAHPNDWEAIRLLRTADGVYIWGNPSDAGPMRIWGVAVVETDAQTENTVLTGDTTFCQLFMRQDVLLEVGYVNDDFLDGRQTFRCGLRVAFAGYRPAAFCQATGM